MNADKLRNEIYPEVRNLVRLVKNEPDFMNVLSELWNVYDRPSTGEDFRYKKLGDEIEKHYVMNDDWSDDKLFISILKITDDEAIFLRFIERILKFYEIESDAENLTSKLNELLSSEGYKIRESERELFLIKDGDDLVENIEGGLKFIRCESRIVWYQSFTEDNIEWPNERNCFVLTYNKDWNDFSYKTWFRLYFIDEDCTKKEVGRVKIMKRETDDMGRILPNTFTQLGPDYCSLGYDLTYYKNMRQLFKEKSYVYLRCLRDASLFSSIHEDFEKESAFRQSLCRDNCSEKALREGRYYVNGRSMEDAYIFTYGFRPEYFGSGDNKIQIKFNFKYDAPSYRRIIGLVGENGVGKSTLIRELAKSLMSNDKQSFDGKRPIFSRVMIVSYSPFDHFPKTDDKPPIGYRYCGLLKKENVLFSQEEQVKILQQDLERIKERSNTGRMFNIWNKIVEEVIPFDWTGLIYSDDDDETRYNKLLEMCKNMSSGETIFLYTVTAIISNIRKDSLLLFDEPEQHLHPQAIAQLLSAIFKVVDRFESYAIIATHSPIVVRELLSENVYVFDREENNLLVRKIGIESFGESISRINDVVFENLSAPKQFVRYVGDVVEKCKYDYEKSVKCLENGENELGLSVRLMIRRIIEKRSGHQ